MAIQLGVVQFRGKLGQTVGRKKSKATKANTLAAYQGEVANPKTLAQRKQRVKMTAAVNFYRALAGILDHSWQGVDYGGASHNEFMKRALLMNNNFPYLIKGDNRPIPGMYPVSSGSLAPIDFLLGNFGAGALEFYPQDKFDLDGATIGEVSQALLSGAPALAEGDQLTFIVAYSLTDTMSEVLQDDSSMPVVYRVARFVIDSSSETDIAQWGDSQGFAFEGASVSVIGADNYVTLGGSIIVSRPPLRDNGPWQRSNSYMQLNPQVLLKFASGAAQNAALSSYGNKVSEASSDWYLNQGNTEGSSTGNTVQRSLTAVSVNIGGQTRSVLAMVQGNTTYLVASAINNGRRSLYQYSGSGNTATLITPDFAQTDVEALGYQVRVLSTVQSYFPQLEITEPSVEDNEP